MSDLVKRLRDKSTNHVGVKEEAADELERLRAELTIEEKRFNDLSDMYAAVVKERDALRKQIDEMQRVPDDWQPIETAPKDEEVFIGRCIDGEFRFGKSVCFWYDGNEMEGEYFHGYVWSIDDVSESIADAPSYWMPLPAAPQPEDGNHA